MSLLAAMSAKRCFKSLRDRQKFLEYLEAASERYHAVIQLTA
jgi:hypothetical protein